MGEFPNSAECSARSPRCVIPDTTSSLRVFRGQISSESLRLRGCVLVYKQRRRKPRTPPPEVRKDILLGTVLWSLGSNAHQHKLVRDYLLGIQQDLVTSPKMKTVLDEVLAWKPKAPPAPPGTK